MSEIESSSRRTERQSRPVVLGYVKGAIGDAALQAAAEEARLRDTIVTVIHQRIGVEVPDRFGPDEGSSRTDTASMFHLLQVAQDAAPGLKHIDVRTVTSPVEEQLLIASRSAELLVLGVTTKHPSTAALFDTVPRAVLQGALCPVLLIGSSDYSIARVVCGVDRSPASVDALRWSADEAALRGTTLLAVEVVPDRRPSARNSEEELSTWVHRCLAPSETTVRCATQTGPPADVLTRIAKSQEAVLVIGVHERSKGHRMHSVARVVTAQTEVPVVVVPGLHQRPVLGADADTEARRPSQTEPTPAARSRVTTTHSP